MTMRRWNDGGRLLILAAVAALPGCVLFESLDRERMVVPDGPHDADGATGADADAEADQDGDDGSEGDSETGLDGDDAQDADGEAGPACGNGSVDPGEQCEPGDTESDTNPCGAPCTRRCDPASCTWMPCAVSDAYEHVCDGLDDDGNGQVDECLWCPEPLPGEGTTWLAIDGTDSANVWAAGVAPGGAPSVAQRDVSTVWVERATAGLDDPAALTAVWTDKSTGRPWAANEVGRVFRFDSAAGTWVEPAAGPPAAGVRLLALAGRSENELWVAGEAGTVRVWDGIAWRSPDLPAAVPDLTDLVAPVGAPTWLVGRDAVSLSYADARSVAERHPLPAGFEALGIDVDRLRVPWAAGGRAGAGALARWSGAEWLDEPVPIPGGGLVALWANPTDGALWLVRRGADDRDGSVLVRDASGVWRAVLADGPTPGEPGYRAIWGTGAGGVLDVWVVGDDVRRYHAAGG